MKLWRTLRKGSINIFVRFAGTFSSNLFAKDICIQDGEPVSLRMDLGSNLRGRSRQTNTYQDARQLADGDIVKLELIQLTDPKIAAATKALTAKGQQLRLSILLESEHRFLCTLADDTTDPKNLTLKVVSAEL